MIPYLVRSGGPRKKGFKQHVWLHHRMEKDWAVSLQRGVLHPTLSASHRWPRGSGTSLSLSLIVSASHSLSFSFSVPSFIFNISTVERDTGSHIQLTLLGI